MPRSLLPPNASQLERALEQAIAQPLHGIATAAHTLWNAQTCPAHLLGYLAWALGVDEWDAQWPEAAKREAIAAAPLVNARRGTIWAVQRVLRSAGVFSEVREWYEPAANPWSTTTAGTFDITVFVSTSITAGSASREITPAIIARIRRMVDAAKPASRHYQLRAALGIDTSGTIAAIGAATAASICTSAGALQPHNTSSALQASSASAVSAAATLHSTSTLQ